MIKLLDGGTKIRGGGELRAQAICSSRGSGRGGEGVNKDKGDDAKDECVGDGAASGECMSGEYMGVKNENRGGVVMSDKTDEKGRGGERGGEGKG